MALGLGTPGDPEALLAPLGWGDSPPAGFFCIRLDFHLWKNVSSEPFLWELPFTCDPDPLAKKRYNPIKNLWFLQGEPLELSTGYSNATTVHNTLRYAIHIHLYKF